jgi:signal transduction histidine kinase
MNQFDKWTSCISIRYAPSNISSTPLARLTHTVISFYIVTLSLIMNIAYMILSKNLQISRNTLILLIFMTLILSLPEVFRKNILLVPLGLVTLLIMILVPPYLHWLQPAATNPTFILWILLPILYNYIPSPTIQERRCQKIPLIMAVFIISIILSNSFPYIPVLYTMNFMYVVLIFHYLHSKQVMHIVHLEQEINTLQTKQTQLNAELLKAKDQCNEFINNEVDATECSEALLEQLNNRNKHLREIHLQAVSTITNPIRKIASLSEYLLLNQGLVSQAEYTEQLKRIMTNAQSLSRFVQSHCDYCKQDIYDVNLASTSLSKTLNEVWESLEIWVKESNARLLFGKLPTIQADNYKLKILLHHLLQNAIQHRANHAISPIIEVDSYEDAQKNLIVTFTDNSGGIPAEKLNLLLSENLLIKPSALHLVGGGVGFLIIRTIAIQHHWKLLLENTRTGLQVQIHIDSSENL